MYLRSMMEEECPPQPQAKKLPPPCLMNRHRDESSNLFSRGSTLLDYAKITKSTFHAAASVLPGALFMNVVPPGFHYPRLAAATIPPTTFPIHALSPVLEQTRQSYKRN
ncbi:hypothetical protein C162_00823 [Paenibacillus sp. FSL R7-269]|nr:hypothetical protein C162_00823 [Paenibacillus sp. FSL R7-269]